MVLLDEALEVLLVGWLVSIELLITPECPLSRVSVVIVISVVSRVIVFVSPAASKLPSAPSPISEPSSASVTSPVPVMVSFLRVVRFSVLLLVVLLVLRRIAWLFVRWGTWRFWGILFLYLFFPFPFGLGYRLRLLGWRIRSSLSVSSVHTRWRFRFWCWCSDLSHKLVCWRLRFWSPGSWSFSFWSFRFWSLSFWSHGPYAFWFRGWRFRLFRFRCFFFI